MPVSRALPGPGGLRDLLRETAGFADQAAAALPSAARWPLAALAASLAGWILLLVVTLILTRPAAARRDPAAQDLPGDEPPAVVNLLVNRWSVTEDAAEATLLDLAARGRLELRQPDADPRNTTVHLPRDDAEPSGRGARARRTAGGDAALTDYERQVLDHVAGIAVGGVAPLTALTFRDGEDAARWARRFEASVAADARRRGLVGRRVPGWAVTLLDLAAVAPALATSWLAWELGGRADAGALLVGLVPYALLAGVAGRRRGLRGTPRGRQAAARWLGLRAYLEVDRAFADLPPAAVAVWDRYLAYGAALGVTRVASAALDLGMGNRRLVWSAYGGQWHQVRVRYPGQASRYGDTARALILRGLVTVAVGVGLAWLYLRLDGRLDELPDPAVGLVPGLGVIGAAGGLLAVRGVYRVARAVLDVVAPRTLCGEVLWVAAWKRRRRSETTVVTHHYLVVDDATSDRTTAWALPAGITRGFGPGDVVELAVRPWSRRVIRLSVVQSRPAFAPPTSATRPS